MKIHNDSPVHKPHGPSAAGGGASKAGQPANAPATDAAAISTSSTTNLIELVAASTDVRDELVANIKVRLAEGEFATQQAAYETAEAILDI